MSPLTMRTQQSIIKIVQYHSQYPNFKMEFVQILYTLVLLKNHKFITHACFDSNLKFSIAQVSKIPHNS